jgi:hypothetical protein
LQPLLKIVPLLLCSGSSVVIWKCFSIAEKLSKQPFKRQLARAIQKSSIFTIGAVLPRFCIYVFDAIFTGNLWSIRGFGRSCVASIITVTILLIFWYSSKPDEWLIRITDLERTNIPNASIWTVVAIKQLTPGPCKFDIGLHGDFHVIPLPDAGVSGSRKESGAVVPDDISRTPAWPQGHSQVGAYQIRVTWTNKTGGGCPASVSADVNMDRLDTFVVLPILYNLFADFTALIITRRIFVYLSRQPVVPIKWVITVFLSSIPCLLVLAYVFMGIVVLITDHIVHAVSVVPSDPIRSLPLEPLGFVRVIVFPFYKNYPELLGGWNVGTLFGVFVWSTLIGIGWLGIFSTSVVIANVSMKLQGVGPWLNKNFHVQRQPFRILAVLAIASVASLCFIYHVLMWIGG